jgi:hypothetical protein
MSSVIDECGYGRFGGAYSRVELERFFNLDDEDRRLIEARRRDYNRLGWSNTTAYPRRVFATGIVPRNTFAASANRTPAAGVGSVRTVPIDPPPALPLINSGVGPTRRGRRARSSRTLPQIKGRCLR